MNGDMGGWIWALVVIGGPILLGIVIFLFARNRRRLTHGEREMSDRVAHEKWGKERIR